MGAWLWSLTEVFIEVWSEPADTPACRNVCCTKRFIESRHSGVQARARNFLGNLS